VVTAIAAPLAELCPTCQVSLVTLFDEPSWCERCEFGLDRFKLPVGLGPLGRAIEKHGMRLGFRLNRRLFASISARDIRRPGITLAFLVLFLVSVLSVAASLAAATGGVLLIIKGNAILAVFGALLIGIAGLLAPRLGRVKPLRANFDELKRPDAPELFGLIEKAAAAVGTKMPDLVFIGPDWNAFAGRYGLRRTRVLMLGVPMWVVLRPQERVALLGHELGHFVNRDVSRGLLTQPACTMFARLAQLLRPDKATDGRRAMGSFITVMAMIVVRPVQWLLCYLLWTIHIGLTLVAARDRQRSEYYADALAMELAGTEAGSFFDLHSDGMTAVIGGRARAGDGYGGWREGVEKARAERAERLTLLRQLSLRRESSPFNMHPPNGMRQGMVATQRYQAPRIVLTEDGAARIDAELARFEASYRRTIAHHW
jgi:Zn-dependent protease with chaperone function